MFKTNDAIRCPLEWLQTRIHLKSVFFSKGYPIVLLCSQDYSILRTVNLELRFECI